MKDVISVGTTGGDTIESQLKQLLSNSITVYGAGTDPKAIVSGATDYLVSELLQLFHSLLISKLPEKKPLVLEKEYSTPRELLTHEQDIKLNTNHQILGFNKAVDDMKSVLDEMFGVQK